VVEVELEQGGPPRRGDAAATIEGKPLRAGCPLPRGQGPALEVHGPHDEFRFPDRQHHGAVLGCTHDRERKSRPRAAV